MFDLVHGSSSRRYSEIMCPTPCTTSPQAVKLSTQLAHLSSALHGWGEQSDAQKPQELHKCLTKRIVKLWEKTCMYVYIYTSIHLCICTYIHTEISADTRGGAREVFGLVPVFPHLPPPSPPFPPFPPPSSLSPFPCSLRPVFPLFRPPRSSS